MSAKLDQFFKKYSIDEISKRTKISPISLNYIKNREFDKLNKVKLQGFIKLIEREFNISLLDEVMKEYEEYHKQKAPQKEPQEEIIEDRSIYIKIVMGVAIIIGGAILYFISKPKHSQTPPNDLTTQIQPKTNQNLSTLNSQNSSTPNYQNISTTNSQNLSTNTQTIAPQNTKPQNSITTKPNQAQKTTTNQIFNLKENKEPKEPKQTPKKITKPKEKTIKQKPTQTKQNTPTKTTPKKNKTNPQKTTNKVKETLQKETKKEPKQPPKEIKKEIKPQPKETNTSKTTSLQKPIKIVPLMKTWIKITNLKTKKSQFIITDKPLTIPYGDYDIQFGFAKAKIYYNNQTITLNKDLIGEVILKNGKYTIK